MKVLLFVFSALLILGCDSSKEIKPTITLTFADSISGQWRLVKVLYDGLEREEWKGLELEIMANSDSTGEFISDYSELNIIESMLSIWPFSSHWSIYDHVITREDGASLSVSIVQNLLKFQFITTISQYDFCNPQIEGCPFIDFGTWEFLFARIESQ